MRSWVLLVALALAGCSGEANIEPDGTVYASPGFAAWQLEAVERSVEEWRVATAGGVSLRLVIGDAREELHRVEPGVVERPNFALTRHGLSAVRILVDVRQVDEPGFFQHVVMHELLHGLGVRGHAGGEGLMAEYAGSQTCIDATALEMACDFGLCREGAAPTC